VKKIFKVIFINFLVITNFSYASSEFCFSEKISFFCQVEDQEKYSLNGSFSSNSHFYRFSGRRAFAGKWCQSTLKKIEEVMSIENFCIHFEENKNNNELTINTVESKLKKWSYFN